MPVPFNQHSKSAKVVHLTTVHAPEDTRIFRKQCQSLVQAGYEVVLIAPHAENAKKNGVHIRGLTPPKHRMERFTVTMKEAYQTAHYQDADLYHFHDPELIPLGLLLKAQGKQVIRDVHEDVPEDIETKYWIHPTLRQVIAQVARLIEWSTTGLFDATVVATPSIAERFNTDRTVLIQNFPLTDELVADESTRSFSERPNTIAYVGDLTKIRGAEQMVRAMSYVSDLDPSLKIAGSFSPPGLQSKVMRLPGGVHTDYLGWLSRAEMAQLFREAMAGLVVFQPAPNHIKSQPNKLFEYMSGGLPVIASDFPLWRDIVGETECGLLVDPSRPTEIADAIRWIFEHPEEAEAMGRRGQKAIREKFNWGNEFDTLHNLYERLLK